MRKGRNCYILLVGGNIGTSVWRGIRSTQRRMSSPLQSSISTPGHTSQSNKRLCTTPSPTHNNVHCKLLGTAQNYEKIKRSTEQWVNEQHLVMKEKKTEQIHCQSYLPHCGSITNITISSKSKLHETMPSRAPFRLSLKICKSIVGVIYGHICLQKRHENVRKSNNYQFRKIISGVGKELQVEKYTDSNVSIIFF